jgi:hypothetical protein
MSALADPIRLAPEALQPFLAEDRRAMAPQAVDAVHVWRGRVDRAVLRRKVVPDAAHRPVHLRSIGRLVAGEA